MTRRLSILSLCLALLSHGALAAEKPKEVGQYVDLQPVGMPIVVDGQLVNYVFVYVRINLKGGVDASRMREREPLFRDALVRAGHRTPFVAAGDWRRVDEAKLVSAMTRESVAIAGAGAVSSVSLMSQSPQRNVMPPRPSLSGRS
jgi:hypothetical protein